MLVSTFQKILNNAVQGDPSALREWSYLKNELSSEELTQAWEMISQSKVDNKGTSYSLFLQGLWHHPFDDNRQSNRYKAGRFYEQAIKLNNSHALYYNGLLLMGCNNIENAIKLFDQAIELGDASAMNQRALIHWDHQEYDQAIELLERAIDSGNLDAMKNRASMNMPRKEHNKNEGQAEGPYRLSNHLKDDYQKDSRSGLQEQAKVEETEKQEESYKKSANTLISKIENVLQGLENKIGQINHHRFPEAQKEAEKLLGQLKDYKNVYSKALLEVPRGDIQTAKKEFKKHCQEAILNAKPILTKDLGWGDYLSNLLKSLANTLIQVVNLGQANSSSLFAYKKALSVEAIENAGTKLSV